MRTIRIWLTTIAVFLYCITSSAYSFQVNGIYYNITNTNSLNREVEVTYKTYNYSSYSGEVVIPATVTYNDVVYTVTGIGVQAFSDCYITSIALPESVVRIGYSAFSGCSGLVDLHINSIESWLEISISDTYAHPNYYAKNIYIEGELLTEVEVPSTIKSIPNYAFNNFTHLKHIALNEGLTSIGDHAFSGCRNLVSITIPESVMSIGGSAFEGCTGDLIVNCNIPSVNHYANAPFYNSKFTSVIIGDSVKHIGDKAFYNCEVLQEIVLPDNLSYIGSSAFSSCTSLRFIHIPQNVTSIRNFTFSGCTNLTNIDLPEALDSIGQDAFSNCESLESVTIPDCVNYIGYSAFSNCCVLTAVNIPRSLRDIKQATFLGCGGLASIFIPKNIESIGPSVFSGCTSLKEVIFEDNIDNLVLSAKVQGAYGEGAFYDCPLEYVYIGRNLDYSTNTTSGYSPFYNKTIKEVTIGNNVSVLGENLFLYCDIETINVLGHVPPEIEPFGITDDICKTSFLRVQYGAKKFFTEDWSWKRFDEIKEFGDYHIVQYVVGDDVFAVDSIAPGIPISIPGFPIMDGHSFSGWGEIPDVMPDDNITISGTFIVNKYLVTFKIGDEVISADSLEYGAAIVLPEVSIKEGHTFSGWSEAPETMPAEDVIISGTFAVNKYLVTFKIGDEVIAADSLEYGATIVAPEAPEKEGYTFDGWGEVVETVPANDVTIEGSYSVNSYLLTYAVDGETVQTDSVTYGTAITLFDEPEKEGHTFNGWSEVPETMPAKDITISGTFTVNKYLVTFKIGDEVIAADSLEYGTTIVAPEVPEKEGYTFDGWGEVAETVPASDVTYEGTYTVNIYKVYYYVGDELVHTAEVAYGEAIPEYVYEPTEEGYTFLGWVGDSYETMPAHDVTYVANIDNGIDQLTNDKSQLTIYDLTGRKVLDTENMKGGIYIINGKKVLVR